MENSEDDQKPTKAKNKTQNFYDRIADVHNLAMKINGYRDSVAKYLKSLDLKIDSDSLVFDAGSGTGIVTLDSTKPVFIRKKLFALDLSLNSLRVSREQFEKDKTTKEKISAPFRENFEAAFCRRNIRSGFDLRRFGICAARRRFKGNCASNEKRRQNWL